LFSVISSDAITPSGRRISALRASVRRISDNGSISSPWPTTTREDARSSARHGYMITGNQGTTLLDAARLSSWPTTQARDGSHGGGQAKRAMGETRHGSNLDDFALLSGWATPLARDQKGPSTNHQGGSDLPTLAGWATPVATEIRNTLENYREMKANMKSGARTAITHPSIQAQLVDSGTIPNGSPASTASRGQLNPDLSRYLMAYPVEWLFACPADNPKPRYKKPSASTGTTGPELSAGSATRSSRSKPSSSSKRLATPPKKRKGKRGR
jgi:hypothetical protein